MHQDYPTRNCTPADSVHHWAALGQAQQRGLHRLHRPALLHLRRARSGRRDSEGGCRGHGLPLPQAHEAGRL